MQVFKLFWKIINKNKFAVFFSIALGFGLSFMFLQNATSIETISDQKVNMAIIDQDKTEVSKALVNYIKETSNVKDIKADKVEDSLFFRDIEYVVYIPKGYEAKVIKGEKVVLDKKQVPDSAGSYIVDSNVSSFTDTLQSYLQYGPELNIKEAIHKTRADISIHIKSENLIEKEESNIRFYYNYLGYSFVSSLIWGIGFVMMSMNRLDIKRRNTVTPVSNFSMNAQICLGALVLGIIMFGISVLFAYTVFQTDMNGIGSYLYLLNLGVWIIPCLALAYLLSSVCKKIEVLSGISNILCLGLAFLGGAFVPQEFMSASILKVSRFIPSYWFVNANDTIGNLASTSWSEIEPIIQAMGIQLLFGVLFFIVAFVINKHRKRNII